MVAYEGSVCKHTLHVFNPYSTYDVKVSVRFPGRQGTDPRNTVTISDDPALPWPVSVHFLRVLDDETDEVELVNVGFEVGQHWEVPGGSPRVELDGVPDPIDAVALKRVVDNYAAYVEYARQALILQTDGMTATVKLLRGPGTKPARLTDDFYRLIASDYNARRASGERYLVKALSDAHHVTAGAASRWIKEAKARGYIDVTT